jgi:hypothetical protein
MRLNTSVNKAAMMVMLKPQKQNQNRCSFSGKWRYYRNREKKYPVERGKTHNNSKSFISEELAQ